MSCQTRKCSYEQVTVELKKRTPLWKSSELHFDFPSHLYPAKSPSDRSWLRNEAPQTPRCASSESMAARNIGERCWLTRAKLPQGPCFFSSLSSHYWGQITATSSFQVAGGRGNRKTVKDRAGENINYLVYYQFHGSIATKLFKGGIKTPSLISWYILSVS